MNAFVKNIREMKSFLLLWGTQSLSGFGSAMTSYALVIWSYSQKGSALATALLMVCSYAPYVLLSIFAGALSDRWDKRRTMLVCDAFAAACTLVTLWLLKTDSLQIWHLYVLNALTGLMNTVQQPASEVATTALLPKAHYQRVGGLRYLASSLQTILTPIAAMALLGLFGMDAVILFDLMTFAAAFLTLLLFIRLPEAVRPEKKEPVLRAARQGVKWLSRNRGVLMLMLFLAAINLVASMYNAALPAMVLSRANENALGTLNAVTGIAMLAGSLIASVMKEPRSRVRVVCNTLLFSMSFENFLLAFGRSTPVWCIGGILGWLVIPIMNGSLDALMRLHIPADIQGRVYAARNSLQFFTIPVGYFLGGWLVDAVFEPLLAAQGADSLLVALFGAGKGAGAGCFFAVLAVTGIAVCLIFRRNRDIWALEKKV